jgi:PleD family two-component response regulator
VHRLAEVLEELRREEFTGPGGVQFQVSFSAGVAEYPADGSDLQTLYRVADQALYLAKETGRNRVLPVGWYPDQNPQRPDVVLVDDDAALASDLLRALETRGYCAAWLKNGQAALDTLGEPRPRLKASVVLLDGDLPDIDGLAVLRRLAQERVVQRTRVILLTCQDSTDEALTASELGAFDHLAKPVSLSTLMQHIRRALQA